MSTAANAPSLSLHLPDETELEAAAGSAADNTADAAEAIEASEAAAAVEEGDEQEQEGEEFLSDVEDDGFDGLEGSPEGDVIEEMSADDLEATLLEEPADEAAESASGEVSDCASPTECAGEIEPHEHPGPITVAATPNRLTPHQPPKSAALVSFEHRRTEARDRYEGAMFEWRKLEAAAKAAKERWKDAEDQLFDVLNEAGDFEGEETAEQFGMHVERLDAPEGRGVIVGPAPETEPVMVVDISAPPPSDAWRSESILSLNLKTTIVDKLIEAGYSTIGKLEDLRADTFAGGLKSIKGIGQAKADAIEDAILNWLSKNRDRAVLAAASGSGASAVEEVDEAAAVEEVAAEESGDLATPAEAVDETASGFAALDQAATDPDWHATIEERSQQIFFRTGDLSSVSPDDCLSQQLEDSRFWESGYEAYNAGHDLIDCGYVPGGERDDWLRGWMSAKLTNEEGWQGPGSEGGRS